MSTVLHVFDRHCPAEAPVLLAALRRLRPGDRFARIGGDPWGDLPAPDYAVRQPWPWVLTAAAGVKRAAEACDAEVIHAWGPTVADAAASTGRPAMVSLFHPPVGAARQTIDAAATSGAAFFTPSQSLRRDLLRRGFDAGRVFVVAPGFDSADRRDDERSEALQRLGLPDAPILLAPALHSRDDGPAWTTWAACILHFVGLEFHVLVHGRGRPVAKARMLAIDTRIDHRLHVTGDGDDAVDADIWAVADIAVLADSRGFSLAVAARAAAEGVPVVAVAAGEMAAELTDGKDALLVEPKTPRLLSRAILRLHEQSDLVSRLTRAARDCPWRSDAAAMAERMEQLYMGAVDRGGTHVAMT